MMTPTPTTSSAYSDRLYARVGHEVPEAAARDAAASADQRAHFTAPSSRWCALRISFRVLSIAYARLRVRSIVRSAKCVSTRLCESTFNDKGERFMAITPLSRPDWLRVRLPSGQNYEELRQLMRSKQLHTVCEEARCPNMGECWGHRTATFMILGSVCTRSCHFCAVATGRPMALDFEEPRRVAEAARQMGLRHVVVTSVNRDEMQDGGATLFAATIRWLRRLIPTCTVEVLTPDFKGSREALQLVMDARPD